MPLPVSASADAGQLSLVGPFAFIQFQVRYHDVGPHGTGDVFQMAG